MTARNDSELVCVYNIKVTIMSVDIRKKTLVISAFKTIRFVSQCQYALFVIKHFPPIEKEDVIKQNEKQYL